MEYGRQGREITAGPIHSRRPALRPHSPEDTEADVSRRRLDHLDGHQTIEGLAYVKDHLANRGLPTSLLVRSPASPSPGSRARREGVLVRRAGRVHYGPRILSENRVWTKRSTRSKERVDKTVQLAPHGGQRDYVQGALQESC